MSGITFLSSNMQIEKPAIEEDTTLLAIKNFEKQIDALERRVASKSSFEADAAISIGLTIIRIASAFLAVYLVQILVGFTRYQFRVADHLEATADSFEFAKGDIDSMSKIISSISPQHIEFGKIPKSPTEHSIDLLKDLASKIPKP